MSWLENCITGLTTLKVEVGNPAAPEISETVEFLVDSGAIYSVVPNPILGELSMRRIHMMLAAYKGKEAVV